MIFGPVEKLLWYGDRVRNWLERGRTDPILFEIAPVGYCNASCPWCLFKDNKSLSQIDTEKALEIIRDLSHLGAKAINWTGGGEPVLHEDFPLFVLLAARLGLKQGLFTNGYQEIPEQNMFEWIRISLTPEGFGSIVKPKVPFGIVLNQTKELDEIDLRGTCVHARDFGAKYFQIRPALVGDYREQPEIEVPGYLKEYETKDFQVHLTEYKYQAAKQPRRYRNCYGYHFCPSIDWNAKLSVCLYMNTDPKFILADLNNTRLIKIWPGIKEKIVVLSECQNCCKNHEINKVLAGAREVEAISFI